MDPNRKPSVLVVLYPGCVFFEVALAVELLAGKFEIVYATPDGQSHEASNGAVIQACRSYQDVELTTCRAVVIPGGDPGSIQDNNNLSEVIRKANDNGLLLAAICAGPLLLAISSVLKGKRIAHGYGPKQLEFLKSYFEGVNITEENVVCDGQIITAKPEAHIDFAVEIACRLQAVDISKANRTKDYYRGILGRKIRPLAIGLIRNPEGQFLFHKGHDKVKGESFYRPLGGGIEFSESGQVALEREIMEELDQAVSVSGLTASFENIFSFEGHKGHEIILLYSADFKNKLAYEQSEFDILESGSSVGKAVWRSVAEIRAEGSKLYPVGLDSKIAELSRL